MSTDVTQKHWQAVSTNNGKNQGARSILRRAWYPPATRTLRSPQGLGAIHSGDDLYGLSANGCTFMRATQNLFHQQPGMDEFKLRWSSSSTRSFNTLNQCDESGLYIKSGI
ncbi:hypothetical protein OK016_23710 [Vibrio chagasii]|nr:hypothetical protein [Vibrio chagasii]